jgi:hypothetical protein
MPKKLENKLKREAAKRGYRGDRARRFVYGTLTNLKKAKAAKRK